MVPDVINSFIHIEFTPFMPTLKLCRQVSTYLKYTVNWYTFSADKEKGDLFGCYLNIQATNLLRNIISVGEESENILL